MDFMELAGTRYSVRDFRDTPVEQEKLDRILEAARIAPTAANKQPQKIYVLKSEDALSKIRAVTRCAFNAPVVFLIAYDTEREWTNLQEPGIHSGEEDVSIVAAHMMLEAWNLGIGSCWVNAFPNTKAAQTFHLPKNEKVVLLMPMGYPAKNACPGAKHTAYRRVEEFVTEL